MGVGYFLKQTQGCFKAVKQIFFYSVFEGCVLIYAVLSMFIQKMAPTNYIFYVVCFAVLLFCFIQKNGKVSQFFEKPVFAKMARYCLSVYLAQGIIVYDVFGYVFNKHPELIKQHITATIFIMLILSCLTGIVVHHAVELPATRALKKLWT